MEQIFQPEVIGPIMGCLVLIVAIGGGYVIRYKRMELEAQRSNTAVGEETQRALLAELKRLHTQNTELSARMERLEANSLGYIHGEAQQQTVA